MVDLEQELEEEVAVVSTPLKTSFPLFVDKDFEIFVNNAPYQAGIDGQYPTELKERLSAAVISYIMQLNSIDYTRKRYIRSRSEESGPNPSSRLDRAIQKACLEHVNLLLEVMEAANRQTQNPAKLGIVVGDSTLARLPFSLGRAFGEANRGALYEATTIARMVLEQIAWIVAITESDDAAQIQRTSVTYSIGALRRNVPEAARLYGWMSRHVHWEYDAHVKAFDFSGEYVGTLLASSKFKAISFAMLVCLVHVIDRALNTCRGFLLTSNNLAKAREKLFIRTTFEASNHLTQIMSVGEGDQDITELAHVFFGGR